MPKLNPIQHSFSAGEISPRMLARSDLETYYKGLSFCHNMSPVSQGPLNGRIGWKYETQVPGTDGRLFGFQRTWDEGYLVVVSDDDNLYVSDDLTHVIGPELVQNGHFASSLSFWTVEQNTGFVFVVGAIVSLQSGIQAQAGIVYITQFITAPNPGTEHLLRVQMPDNDGHEVEVRIGTTEGGNELFTFSGGGTVIEGVFVPGQDFLRFCLESWWNYYY